MHLTPRSALSGFFSRSPATNFATKKILERRERRRAQAALLESEQQQVMEVIDPAITHFEAQADERGGLPTDSPERIFINGVLGTLKGIRADLSKQDSPDLLKTAVTNAVDTVTSLFSNHQGDLRAYADTLIDGLQQLANHIEEEPEAGEGDEVAAPAESTGAGIPQEEILAAGEEAPPEEAPPEGTEPVPPGQQPVAPSSDKDDLRRTLAAL